MARARTTRVAGATVPAATAMYAPGLWAQNWQLLSYNPADLLNNHGIDLYDRMMLDDMVKASISFKTESVLTSGWTITSPEHRPANWDVAEFIRRQIGDINDSFTRTLRGIMTGMIYGFSVTEKTYRLIPDGPDKNLIGIDSLKTKPPHYLRFDMAEDGRINGIRSDNSARGEVHPIDKFIVWSYGDNFGNPYGRSDLEPCYRAYALANNSYRWLGQYMERLGVPPWFAMYNPQMFDDPRQLNSLKAILTNLQNSTAAAIPRTSKDDFEIWTPQNNTNVQSIFAPVLQLLKADIARALLMPGHLGVSPDQSQGSLAKARVALDMFLLSISAIQGHLREVVQEQLIRELVDLNFLTGGDYPKFQFLPLGEEDIAQIIATWVNLVDSDIVSVDSDDERHIREMMGFPRTEPDESPEGADDEKKPRIPFRYLEKLGPALTVDEVRSALGLDPFGDERGEALMKEPPPAPVVAPPGEEGEDDPDEEDEGGTGPGNPQAANDDGQGEGGSRVARQTFPAKAEKLAATGEGEEAEVLVPDPDAPGLTSSERRCDFAAIVAGLDGLEEQLTQRVASVLRKAIRAQVGGWRAKPPTLIKAPKVKAALPLQLRPLVLSGFKRALRDGQAAAKAEVEKARPGAETFANELPTYDPVAALKYLEGKTDLAVAGMNGAMTDVLRRELLFGIRNGDSYVATAGRVQDALAPWIGAPDADPAALRPDRVLTAVRTNATDVYNQGRVIEARRQARFGLVTGMQHSSVLDRGTTPICRSLHGKCYRIDDPDLDALTPPLHHRCRSILTPIVIGDEVSSDPAQELHWATPEEVAAAKRAVPGEFGGSFTATKANAPKLPLPVPPSRRTYVPPTPAAGKGIGDDIVAAPEAPLSAAEKEAIVKTATDAYNKTMLPVAKLLRGHPDPDTMAAIRSEAAVVARELRDAIDAAKARGVKVPVSMSKELDDLLKGAPPRPKVFEPPPPPPPPKVEPPKVVAPPRVDPPRPPPKVDGAGAAEKQAWFGEAELALREEERLRQELLDLKRTFGPADRIERLTAERHAAIRRLGDALDRLDAAKATKPLVSELQSKALARVRGEAPPPPPPPRPPPPPPPKIVVERPAPPPPPPPPPPPAAIRSARNDDEKSWTGAVRDQMVQRIKNDAGGAQADLTIANSARFFSEEIREKDLLFLYDKKVLQNSVRVGTPTTIQTKDGFGQLAAGHYDPKGKEIVLAPFDKGRIDSKVIAHEVGHAMDRALANDAGWASDVISGSGHLQSIMNKEIQAMPSGVRETFMREANYYLQNSKEMFAETFATLRSGPDRPVKFARKYEPEFIRKHFPLAIERVNELLARADLDPL